MSLRDQMEEMGLEQELADASADEQHRLRAALAASQARVAELEAESAAKDAALHAMREKATLVLSGARWMLDSSSAVHTEFSVVGSAALADLKAALSLEAVKLAADAQARRDEAVASEWREREAQRLERLSKRNDNYTADFKEGVRQCALMIRVGPTTTPLDGAALAKVKP